MNRITRRSFAGLGLLGLTALAARHVSAQPACSSTSNAEEVVEGIDLRGKTAVITGCNSGIGYEVMRVLALQGAHVVGTARTAEKGRAACRSIKGRATPVVLELSDFDSVRRCAAEIESMQRPIDMLILNAGIVLDTWQTVHGLEKQFVVNHLGHFLLTMHLLERVKSAPQGRIVVVGSGSHRNAPTGGIQFQDLSGKSWHARGYAHSKLANGLFSLELAGRLKESHVTANCVSPGHTRTNILRSSGDDYRSNAKTPAQGAASVCFVACSPSLSRITGQYFADCVPVQQSSHQTDAAMAAKLWDVSARLTGCSSATTTGSRSC